MKCPYDLKGCDKVNTSGMSMDIECKDCERFNYGIRSTGALPDRKGFLYALLFSAIIWSLIIILLT